MLKLHTHYQPILQKLLQNSNFEIIDIHTHPLEVMNMLDLSDFSEIDGDLFQLKSYKGNYDIVKEGFSSGGFITNLNHNKLGLGITKFAFNFLSSMVQSSIRESYAFIGRKRIIDEMDTAKISKMVLLAVPPFNTIDKIFKLYGSHERYSYLGSIDVHKTDKLDVEEEIKRQIRDYNIIGIKLHPNLQGFYPYPDDNTSEIATRLETLYNVAAKYGLFVLMHGGFSNILSKRYQLQKYPYMLGKSGGHYALPKNYYNENGQSKLLDKFNCTFILAHMAHFAIKRPNVKALTRFYNNYENLWLDTSSVSSKLISQVIEKVDISKIIFGSDAMYNKQLNEILICLKGIKDGCKPELFEETCYHIFGANYTSLINNIKKIK